VSARGLRVRRLRGEMDDARWAACLSAAETRRGRNARTLQPDVVLVDVGADVLRRTLLHATTMSDVRAALAQLEELRELTNGERRAVAAEYGDDEVLVVDTAWFAALESTRARVGQPARRGRKRAPQPQSDGE